MLRSVMIAALPQAMSNPTPTTETLLRYAAPPPIGITYPVCPSAISATRSARVATSRSCVSVFSSWVPKIPLSMLDEITVHEPLLAQHALAGCVVNFLAKTGPARDEGVKLTALAARVRRRRQIGEQGAIELAPREIGVDLGRIDA